MPSSTANSISAVPDLSTITRDKTSTADLSALLSKLEASLESCRDSLEKALNKCLDTERELERLARSPLYKNFVNRSASRNAVDCLEFFDYCEHLEQAEIPDEDRKFYFALGEEIQTRIGRVMRVQRQKSSRVSHMEKLYAKEENLSTGIKQVRAMIRKREVDRVQAKRVYLGERQLGGLAMVDPWGRVRRF